MVFVNVNAIVPIDFSVRLQFYFPIWRSIIITSRVNVELGNIVTTVAYFDLQEIVKLISITSFLAQLYMRL
jgi:hypothetical protein